MLPQRMYEDAGNQERERARRFRVLIPTQASGASDAVKVDASLTLEELQKQLQAL
jgi:hypothetical protein